jgi:hypothetical protein
MRSERARIGAVLMAFLPVVLLAACSRSDAKPAAATARTEATQAAAPTTQTRAQTQATVPATAAPVSQTQESASFNDPKDVNLPLDIKTVTHADDPSTITYTVETYDAFRDDQADFAWEIDKDGDGRVDTVVGVEYEDGRLDAKVETPQEKELGPASVTRIGPSALRVSFARRFVGPAASYQYRVKAVSDLNHNDEEDPGETDVAPDTGFYTHRL